MKELMIQHNANIKSKKLQLTIQIYRCYEHEDPSSCNTTICLSVSDVCTYDISDMIFQRHHLHMEQ